MKLNCALSRFVLTRLIFTVAVNILKVILHQESEYCRFATSFVFHKSNI